MVEAIIVGLVLVVLIYYLIHTWIGSYKEGDYVVWFGGLYKVISVEGEFIIIEDHTSLKMVHLVEITQPRLKKVSNKFAEKYLSLKSNYEGKLELYE
ncbi:MAG: hypothetical protein KDD24_10075 [Flavobacteriales bacterium]|nr:hypothetical protein [Flavobacteriales bacterium]